MRKIGLELALLICSVNVKLYVINFGLSFCFLEKEN